MRIPISHLGSSRSYRLIQQSNVLQRGFTLLELIVVIAIIGILFGITISMVRFDRHEAFLKDKSYEFANFYTASLDHAILNAKAIRLRVEENKLHAQKRQNGEWQNFSLDQRYPYFVMDGNDMQVQILAPILLSPSGKSSVFEIYFRLDDYQRGFSVDGLGRLTPISSEP